MYFCSTFCNNKNLFSMNFTDTYRNKISIFFRAILFTGVLFVVCISSYTLFLTSLENKIEDTFGNNALIIFCGLAIFCIALLLARQIYLKFKFFKPGYLQGAEVFGRFWKGDIFYPVFGKIILLTRRGMVVSSGFIFNSPAKNKVNTFLRKLFAGKFEDILIDPASVVKVESKSTAYKTKKISIYTKTLQPITFTTSGDAEIIRNFCQVYSITFKEL